VAVVTQALERFVQRGRLVEGEFRPGGTQREWCDNDALRFIRRRSLAKLRHEVEPVEVPAFARLLTSWQGATKKRRGIEALLETIETLQGYAMPASIFENEILGARIDEFRSSDLDMLSAAGEIVWVGVEPLGDRDGRVALYLTDHLPLLHTHSPIPSHPVVDYLTTQGASFFAQIHAAVGGFANDVTDALWDLVWKGVVTNDTFHALRAFTRRARSGSRPQFRSRRTAPATTQGRWSLVPLSNASTTERAKTLAQQLINRYGVLVRETAAVESIEGGFSAIYPVLKAMEESGRIRRGYFIAGLGATQFATGGALDLLRGFRDEPEEPESVMLAATDPANPYGSLVKWPAAGLTRSVGASVILVNGLLACYIARGDKELKVFLPEDEPSRSMVAKEIARALAAIVAGGARRALLITEVNDEPVARSAIAAFLVEAGFRPSAMGYQMRVIPSS
jgi:ATP-dependent Lhr-like helicase